MPSAAVFSLFSKILCFILKLPWRFGKANMENATVLFINVTRSVSNPKVYLSASGKAALNTLGMICVSVTALVQIILS